MEASASIRNDEKYNLPELHTENIFNPGFPLIIPVPMNIIQVMTLYKEWGQFVPACWNAMPLLHHIFMHYYKAQCQRKTDQLPKILI